MKSRDYTLEGFDTSSTPELLSYASIALGVYGFYKEDRTIGLLSMLLLSTSFLLRWERT